MRKYLFKILIFLALVAVADLLGGMFFRYWYARIDTGAVGKEQYIVSQADEDLLIFGSSRAEFHYDPRILHDTLGMTCYNCGASGYGIILAYARLKMVTQRHRPQVIVLDVSRDFDIVKSDNNKIVGALKPYYQHEGIDSVVLSIDSTEKYKMLSQLYRFNSNLHHNPKALFKDKPGKRKPDAALGYLAQKGEFDKMKVKQQGGGLLDITEVDSLKLQYVEKFIDLAQGSHLFFVVSPIWYGMPSAEIKPIRDICQRRGVPIIDFSNDKKYVHNDSLFKDGKHLNQRGAETFSKDLAHMLRQTLQP